MLETTKAAEVRTNPQAMIIRTKEINLDNCAGIQGDADANFTMIAMVISEATEPSGLRMRWVNTPSNDTNIFRKIGHFEIERL